MATLYSAAYLKNPAPCSREHKHEYVVPFTFSAALAANDVAKILKLPKGANLLGTGWFMETSADFDSSTNLTLTLRVNDGTTSKTIISASTIGQGAAGRVSENVGNGSLQVGWIGFETTNESFDVEILVAAGPSTATSGTINVGVSFSLDKVL